MPRAKKPTTIVLDEEGNKTEVTEVGVPGLFQPQRWDIDEEFLNNEALREHRKSWLEDC